MALPTDQLKTALVAGPGECAQHTVIVCEAKVGHAHGPAKAAAAQAVAEAGMEAGAVDAHLAAFLVKLDTRYKSGTNAGSSPAITKLQDAIKKAAEVGALCAAAEWEHKHGHSGHESTVQAAAAAAASSAAGTAVALVLQAFHQDLDARYDDGTTSAPVGTLLDELVIEISNVATIGAVAAVESLEVANGHHHASTHENEASAAAYDAAMASCPALLALWIAELDAHYAANTT